MVEIEVKIRNKDGIHARPAALFVQEASKFKSNVTIVYNGMEADGKSILNILMLGIQGGTKVKLIVDGPDEEEAVAVLSEIIHRNFNLE